MDFQLSRNFRFICYLILAILPSGYLHSSSKPQHNAVSIDARDYGLDASSADNAKALKNAISAGKSHGLPVIIPGSNQPYKVKSDIVLSGDYAMLAGGGGNAHLELIDAKIVIGEHGEKFRGQVLRDLVLSKSKGSGPVILVKTTRKARHSRFTWDNIHIIRSSGDGVEFQGSYLGAITGLWITKCEGTGIIFRPGTEEESNAAGGNSLGFFGGEVQSCNWGIEATDTKSITFNAFAVEGNRVGGIWLHGDNRVFTFNGGYFENNGKQGKKKTSGFYDIVIGDSSWAGKPNRNILFSNNFFSDGRIQHKTAVFIETNQKNIVFDSPVFWAYGSSPIAFAGGKKNNSTGRIVNGSNERPDNKNISVLDTKLSSWAK